MLETLGGDLAELVTPEQLEASVRRERDGTLRGGRMMIERASASVVERVLARMRAKRSRRLERLLDAAHQSALPLIAGWDRGVAKVYVNASDASVRVRQSVAERIGVAQELAPHVVGLNLGEREECKAYRHDNDASELAAPIGASARTLAERALEVGIAAGGVTSWDIGEDGSSRALRAFFVALREGDPAALEAAFGHLPGFSLEAIERALGFAPIAFTSIGIACAEPDCWTVYGKMVGSPRLFTVDPTAIFRSPAGEIGIYARPDDPRERAYARRSGWALSYRVREGEPTSDAIRALLEWALERVASRDDLAHPPAPWQRVP